MFDFFISVASAEAVAEAAAVSGAQASVAILFSMLPLFILIVLIMLVVVLILAGSRKKTNSSNMQRDAMPVEEVKTSAAVLITKRNPGGSEYYAGFELENSERMEFWVSGAQYGLLLEGDRGTLTWQGRRLISFDRSAA